MFTVPACMLSSFISYGALFFVEERGKRTVEGWARMKGITNGLPIKRPYIPQGIYDTIVDYLPERPGILRCVRQTGIFRGNGYDLQ